MSLKVTKGYNWSSGEIFTASKGNSSATPSITDYTYQVVSDLRAATFTTETTGTEVKLVGYTAAGDGSGGALYVDKVDTTTTDNGGTVFVAADGTRVKRNFSGALNAKWFGCKGDGVNDYAAIVLALNAASALTSGGAGATVYFPSGTYASPTKITIPDRVKIMGDGSRTTIFNSSVAGALFEVDSTTHNAISRCRISLGSNAAAIGIDFKTSTGSTRWGRYDDIEIASSSVAGQIGIRMTATLGNIITENTFSRIHCFGVHQGLKLTDIEANFFNDITIDTFGVTAASAILSQSNANFIRARVAGSPAAGSFGYQENGARNVVDLIVDIGASSSALSVTGDSNIIRLSRPEALTPVGPTVSLSTSLIDADLSATELSWTSATLGAGWNNSFGSPFPAAGYLKTMGVVYLRGNLTGGTGTAFTLPAGYRPSSDVMFPVFANSDIGRVKITSAGVVTLDIGTATSVTLSGIQFPVA